MSDDTPHSHRAAAIVAAAVALMGTALLLYSQWRAFAWDEGFHLLTAQLIDRGKRPYLDFCFSQTPLNAYWNAFWMRIFGDTWRTAHAVAAIMTSLAVLLTAGYVLRRFPVPRWRLAAALSTACFVGMNSAVFEYGAIAQAYGLCIFLIVSAYLFTVAAADRPGFWQAAAAGFLASAAANASLLTAPVAPVLFVWLFFCNSKGNRWVKSTAFLAAAAAACIPLLRLFLAGPRQTIFNVLEYNMRYRQRNWDGALEHNIDQWSAWIASPQAWLLALLALGALLFIRRHEAWTRALRQEFYLCAWLAALLMVHISTALPTFTRYYLLAVPFLSILASAGLYAAGSRLAAPDRPFWPVFVAVAITFLFLARIVYGGRDDFKWSDIEAGAAKVKSVTPIEAPLLADELTYFVTRHSPPSGMELADSHKLSFPPDVEARLHVISQKELDRRVQAKEFATVEVAEDEDESTRLGLARLYAHSAKVGEVQVFWSPH
ncbi:MAG: hypothetical protein ABSH50_18410 [Bryobacteraceae bacterium]|jgi:4-amino-4-deoxy-L-arabinose transferase-like glycosyltransferase